MKLEGSIEVWNETPGGFSIYATNDDEPGALGYNLGTRSAVLLFELTALRLQGKAKEGRG